jgi:hypothetical protein
LATRCPPEITGPLASFLVSPVVAMIASLRLVA